MIATVARAAEITKVLGTHLVLHRLTRHKNKPAGQRLREACELLGTTFIKLGQYCSTRYDLLPADDCRELQKLLDKVPPVPLDLVRTIFRHDFGAFPEDVFDSFDPEPIASASISQVHRAVLDGNDVAVKVRRPWIGRRLESDLRIFRTLIRAATILSPRIRKLRPLAIAKQLSEALLHEIDFRIELRNLKETSAYYAQVSKRPIRKGLGKLHFPAPYEQFCSYNVLTMSYLDGKTISATVASDPEAARSAAMTVINTSVRFMIDEEMYVFQADNHPGNYLVMRDGVGVVDFGMIGRLDKRLTALFKELVLACYTRNGQLLLDVTLDIASLPRDSYEELLRDDFEAFSKYAATVSIGSYITDIVKILIRNRIPIPKELGLFGRCYASLDGIFQLVSPGASILDLLEHEFSRGMKKKMLQNLKEIDLVPLVYTLSEKVKKSPKMLNKLIERYYGDPLRFVSDVRDALRA